MKNIEQGIKNKKNICITPLRALVIVQALAKVSLESLIDEQMLFKEWKQKRICLETIKDFAEVAAKLAETPDDMLVCRYLSDINKEEEENKK